MELTVSKLSKVGLCQKERVPLAPIDRTCILINQHIKHQSPTSTNSNIISHSTILGLEMPKSYIDMRPWHWDLMWQRDFLDGVEMLINTKSLDWHLQFWNKTNLWRLPQLQNWRWRNTRSCYSEREKLAELAELLPLSYLSGWCALNLTSEVKMPANHRYGVTVDLKFECW